MTDSKSLAPVARFLPMLVGATFFMEYLDTTVIATALPQMAQSFGVGPAEVSLGMTAYMLALAVFIPVSGWVADRFGSRTVFGAAIVVFTLASLLCAASNSVPTFTAARVLQGLGGAMMVPVGRLIVVRNTDKSRLMKAISTITWPGIIAPVVGPPIGGFITTYASWRWIFWLNLPFGIVCCTLVALWVRNERRAQAAPLDWIGFALSGLALTLVLYGMELAADITGNLLAAGLCVAGGVAIGFVAVRHAARHAHPLIDYRTVRIPTFSVTVLTGSVSRVAIGAPPYLMPLLFQIGFGMSAFDAGLVLLATAAGNLGMKAFTTPVLQRFGFRMVAIVDVLLCAALMAICGLLTPHTPLLVVLAVLLGYGLTRSMMFTTLATLAYADVPAPQMAAASTLSSAVQQMTSGMGVAFGAVLLRFAAQVHGGHASYTLGDFRMAFILSGVLALVSVGGYWRLPHDAGARLGGGTRRA